MTKKQHTPGINDLLFDLKSLSYLRDEISLMKASSIGRHF